MAYLSQIQQFLSGKRKDASSKPPFLLSWRSSTLFIMLTVSLAIFTDIFYYALVVPVIPFALTVQAGLQPDEVQRWTAILLACYSLALFVASPVAGLYADHTSSRRWPMLLGLVALAGSTVLLCFGTTIWLLVLGRLLQGASAGIVWSVGCALLVDTMGKAVGVAMGYINVAMSIGLLIAPAAGGAVYAQIGYHPVYYIAFGIVAVDILMRLFMIEKKVARQWISSEESTPPETRDANRDIEIAAVSDAQASSTVESAAIGNDQEKIAERSQSSTDVTSAPIGNHTPASATAAEPPPQRHSRLRPVVILIKSPRLLTALYGIVTEAGIMMGFDAVLALFVQSTFHWNSTQAGLLFLTLFGPGFVSPVVGWLSDKYGAKWPVTAGLVVTMPTLICLRFVTDDTVQHKIILGFLLAILGAALTVCATPLMAEIGYVISEMDEQNPGIFGEEGIYGLGYGVSTMAFALGGVVGPLWAGYVHDGPGWGTMTWTFGVWSASAMVVVMLCPGSKRQVNSTDGFGEAGIQ